MTRIAINGFGRIGRNVFKVALTKKEIEVVAINDLIDARTLAHLLKYDTVFGRYNDEVTSGDDYIAVGSKKVKVFNEAEPEKLPWRENNIDVVIEATGRFATEDDANKHLLAGARNVILSAPAKEGNVPTVVLGVNNEDSKKGHIISNASCTTNCITPIVSIMDSKFKVLKSLMTTIHAYTADQNIQDTGHKDLRRARAAAANIVPTTTGAAKASTQVFTALENKFDGIAIRVPVINGSISDIVMLVEKKTSVDEVNNVLKVASSLPRYKNVLSYTEEPIVSSDIVGNPHSAIADLSLTKVIDGDFVKIVAWYDNEWGYSNRMVETAIAMTSEK